MFGFRLLMSGSDAVFIAAWSCSLVTVLFRPAFDIEVAPVKAIRPDEALVLNVTMTYRGARQVRVDTVRSMNPCSYELPASWKATPKRDGHFSVMVGPGFYCLDLGESARHTIRVSQDYDLKMPPGDYEIRVRARLREAEASYDSPFMESAWVKVPVRILAPDAK